MWTWVDVAIRNLLRICMPTRTPIAMPTLAPAPTSTETPAHRPSLIKLDMRL
jgi:hypothetical protein